MDKIRQLAIPMQIFIMSMHIPSLVKIHWYLLKLSSRNENTDVLQADNSVKNWWNLPITKPNQISTIWMHTLSLVKIYWHLLKLPSRNKNMDGRIYNKQTDWQMDGHTDSQRDTIILHHYHVVGYKNSDNYQNLVYFNLKTICAVSPHGLPVHQVSTWSCT